MPERFDSFDEVREQTEADLLDLLRTGDGPERVWAAWSLGLRLGREAVHALSPGSQPDPGVRAHLVVVLAGFGGRDALRVLAESDPDATVRACACVYLMRTAAEDQIAGTSAFLHDRLVDDPSPEPRIRILRCLTRGWPPVPTGTVERLLSDAARDVRLTAIEYLRATHRGLEPGWEGSTWKSLASLTSHGDPRVQLRIVELCPDWSDEEALGWLGSVAESPDYVVPPDRLASSDIERLRRDAHHEARALARVRVLDLASDPRFSGPRRPLEGALRRMLTELEAELEWLLATDLEYLEDEGLDVRAEVDELTRQRAVIRAALERSSPDTENE